MRIRLTIVACAATLLASLALYPLFKTATWFGSGLGAVLTVGLAGVLTRKLRLPVLACLAIVPVALLIYLTAMYASGPALLGVIPTPASISYLSALLQDGWQEVFQYAPPVPVLPGIELMSTGGIGLIAFLVDLLAVRLRRAAPAGLPLLAMYALPARFRQESTGWLVFLPGAAGYLALLVTDARDRLSGWGRPIFTRHWSGEKFAHDRPDSRPLAVTGRRIGLTAVVIAIVVPLAVPDIHPRWLPGSGGDGPGGLTTVTTPDPLVSLKRQLVRQDDAVVLTYRTTDDLTPEYLRMYSLDRFDGDGWTYSPMHGDKNAQVDGKTLPAAPGLGDSSIRTVSTRIAVDSHVRGMNVLPTPYPPTKVGIKGDWRVDAPSLMIFSLRDSAGGRTYTVSSVRPTPTYQQLESTEPIPSDVASRYLAVPHGIPSDVVALANRLTASASTPYDRAVKLQQWFVRPGNFTYSLDAPSPRNVGALRDFLFTSRTGYCEQFAASMALLARIIGIPARVGMGYTAGTRQSDGSWIVRTKDTHAWPELYFSGIGWLRFEPTPSGGGGQGSATVPDYTAPQLLPGAPTGGSTSRLPSTGSTPDGRSTTGPGTGLRHRPDPLDRNGAAGAFPPPDHGGPPIGRLLLLLAVLLLLATPATLHRLAGVRRWAGSASNADVGAASGELRGTAVPVALRRLGRVHRSASNAGVAHAAWDELRIAAVDFGLPWRAGDSPRATARRLMEARPLGEPATDALARLVKAEELARYAPTPGPATGLRDDARAVRAAIAAGAGRRRRWRVRLLPPSALLLLRHGVGRVLDAFDRLDSLSLRRRQSPS
ncbi:transglutaminase TgpA family protein [Actinoallomurus sp. CA-150999]|uniref:transglutaminase TgpA family protein n=1 Tax=Actinoallomurus sp. CA-150999 TaxID=3239887 RepID=UPI003D8A2775